MSAVVQQASDTLNVVGRFAQLSVGAACCFRLIFLSLIAATVPTDNPYETYWMAPRPELEPGTYGFALVS
jgi:hypothetical protein